MAQHSDLEKNCLGELQKLLSTVIPTVPKTVCAEVKNNFVTVKWTTSSGATTYRVKFDGPNESQQLVLASSDVRFEEGFHLMKMVGLIIQSVNNKSMCCSEWSDAIPIEMNQSPPPWPAKINLEVREDHHTISESLPT